MKKKILISGANGPIMRSLILHLKKKASILLALMRVDLVMQMHSVMNFINAPMVRIRLF